MSATIRLPYLLDFYPLQDEKYTRIHQFFTNLKAGRFTTTKCRDCGKMHWQPRAVCPDCGSENLDWVDLPKTGEVHAFTAMLLGAPMGFEKDMPFVIALVKLDGLEFKILSRIDGIKYEDCKIGQKVKFKTVAREDGRVFFRFEPMG
jgi:uncharacterized OB-fold protein